ncbi:MAG: hypothetical protein IJM64_08815 [Ottowia sp.]|nr:hypothetical protein [Ottowia sp.]
MKPVTTLLAAACAALLLAGCASTPSSPPVIKAQVRSVTTAPGNMLRAGVRYRFEHLPLQQNTEMSQQVHALAQQALSGVGLVRDDAAALVSVQVQARSAVDWIYDEWPAYRSRFYWGLGFGGRRGGIMFGGPMWWRADPTPVYISEAGFVMRAVNGGQVLYETHARHDSLRAPGERTFAALFAAALQGFPTPPAGVHSVSIPLEAPPAQSSVPLAPAPLPAASAPPAAQ